MLYKYFILIGSEILVGAFLFAEISSKPLLISRKPATFLFKLKQIENYIVTRMTLHFVNYIIYSDLIPGKNYFHLTISFPL